LPAVLLEHLAPVATLITPNLPEAAMLLGCDEAQNEKDMHRQMEALMKLNLNAVLLKGGHLPGEAVIDRLATRSGVEVFRSEKIATTHTHGSGCALATAIAVGLAKNQDLATAVGCARTQVRTYIQNASRHHFVQANGPLVHFNLQEKE
jgi:hydroxymethylpyrimidine/phosphomethylpyrimidine kinase